MKGLLDLLFVTKIKQIYIQGQSEEVARLSRKITALEEKIPFSRPLSYYLLLLTGNISQKTSRL